MVQSKKLRRLLTDWTQRSRDGETLTDMLVQAREVDQLFALALKHAPEEELSTVCTNLAEMYHEQAEIYLDRFIMATSAVLITVVGIVIGLLILSLFTPFIQIVNTLAID